jgi:two-component system heavy metal sensor histidine kinase CusS
VAIVITSLVLFGSFYYATIQILKSQTDREITLHAQVLTQLAALPMDQTSEIFSQMPGMLVAISDAQGNQIFTSQPITKDMDILKDTLEKAANIIKPVFVDRKIGTISFRMGVFPVVKNGITTSLVLVAHPVDVITHSLNNLVGILIVLMFSVGISASLVSFFMAKSSLFPLTRLTKSLQDVETTNLNHHLPVPNTQDEIAQLTSTFNSMLTRLDGSFNRERQFIGDVAHELKTPLSTLISRIEVALSRNRNNDEFKNIMSENLVELNRLSATVNDVLDLAWAQSGEIESQFADLDLSKLTEEIGELLENLSTAKKIQVVSEITSGVEVRGLRQKLFRAIYNLADNAVKFTPTSGKVALSLRKEGNSAILEVSNTGLGIAPADMPYVFKRFYRGKVNSVEGTGLGLSICKSIVEAHYGSLNVASTPKKITTFTIKLPATSKSS